MERWKVSPQETNGSRPAIGLAMAGGGPQGAIHEIGAIMALNDAIEGFDLNDLQIYVGSAPAPLSRPAWPTS